MNHREFYDNHLHLGFDKKKNPYFLSKKGFHHMVVLGSTGCGKTVLCKNLCEDLLVRGVAGIILDTQGDLVTMARPNAYDHNNNFSDYVKVNFLNVEKRVFTPISDKGIPLSISPFKTLRVIKSMTKIEYKRYVASVSDFLTNMVENRTGKHFGEISSDIYETLIGNESLNSMAKLIKNLPKNTKCFNKLKLLYSGINKSLFDDGVPLDIGLLLKPIIPDKVPLNLIHVRSLPTPESRRLFITALLSATYEYIVNNPQGDLKVFLFFDEAENYMPSGRSNPKSKQIIKMLAKRGRKFGLGLILATQNKSDIDPKILGQSNHYAMGYMLERPDQASARAILNYILEKKKNRTNIDKHISDLATAKAGQFKIISPHADQPLIDITNRWTHTKHSEFGVINIDDIPKLNQKYIEDYFKLGKKPDLNAIAAVENRILNLLANKKMENYNPMGNLAPGSLLVKYCTYCYEKLPIESTICFTCKKPTDD